MRLKGARRLFKKFNGALGAFQECFGGVSNEYAGVEMLQEVSRAFKGFQR